MLVGLLVAGTLVGLILMSLTRMLNLGFRGTKHAEVKGDITSLRETLRQMVSCDQTWATGIAEGPIDNSTDCANKIASPPALPKPIVLRDRNGNAITGPLREIAGDFDPKAGKFEGSGTLGQWELRAYCDANVGSLVIRAARPTPQGFYADPLTKREYDWGDSPSNPVFGTAASRLCVARFGAGASACEGANEYMYGFDPGTGTALCRTVAAAPPPPPPPPPPPAAAGTSHPTKNCTKGQVVTGWDTSGGILCSDMFKMVSSTSFQGPFDQAGNGCSTNCFFRAEVDCGEGWKVTGGGIAGSASWPNAVGEMRNSFPSGDGRKWRGSFYASVANSSGRAIYALCRKD